MSAARLDVRAELDGARARPFHWLLVGLVFAATLFDGYVVAIPSYVIPFVAKPWHLSPSASGLLVSAGLIGVVIGSFLHGTIADRLGRRPVMIAGLLISGVFSLATAIAGQSYGSFLWLRLATGVGLGVIMPLGTAYINEYLPARSRYRLASLATGGISLGAVLASVLGIVCTPRYGWPSLFAIGAAGIVLAAGCAVWFPESTEYLVSRGRTEQAARLMSRVRPDRAELYRDSPEWSVESSRGDRKRDRLLPLRRPYTVTTVALWCGSFFLLFINYGLAAWTPNLMLQRGDGFATGFGFGAALHSLPVLGGLACGYAADRWLGRRVSFSVWCGLGSLSLLSLLLTHQPVANLAAVAAAGFFLIGGQFMLNNVCAMTYPVWARGTGTGYMLGFGRFGGILGPYISGALLGVFVNRDLPFLAAAIAAALAMLTGAFLTATDTRPAAEAAPAPSVTGS
jgi:MFS family permease